MRLVLLADHTSPHTQKWARSMAPELDTIMIFSLSSGGDDLYADLDNIIVNSAEISAGVFQKKNVFSKLVYLMALSKLKQQIMAFKPDIIHAHYATSYGLLGALSGFHPFIISVWGSDVFEFPSNLLKKWLLRYNLKRADNILATGHVLAEETKKYTSKSIEITPFGVDPGRFRPFPVESPFEVGSLVIGTVKALEYHYGIRYLIEAFGMLKEKTNDEKLKLLIVGGGSLEADLKQQCRSMGLEGDSIFTGRVAHDQVPGYLNMLDIYVALSEQESFGVAVLEASACEIPVVVSDIGGLREVVENGKTGFLVEGRNPSAACEAILQLVRNSELRSKMGKMGRKRVSEDFNWRNCVVQMLEIYKNVALKTHPPVNSR